MKKRYNYVQLPDGYFMCSRFGEEDIMFLGYKEDASVIQTHSKFRNSKATPSDIFLIQAKIWYSITEEEHDKLLVMVNL